MSLGKETPQVYDFLMSIDYGACIGPVDSVNQIWVKDKPIFCGKVTTRADIPIDLPDLFGGDEGEGGVRGIVEVYMGSETQVSSEDLTARWGLTPETGPGYRGLCHLFFRGGEVVVPYGGIAYDYSNGNNEVPPGVDPGEFFDQSELDEEALADFQDSYASGGATSFGVGGWQWTTNNPYLPDTKVNATWCPPGAGGGYEQIWPLNSNLTESSTAIYSGARNGISWFIDDDFDTFVPDYSFVTLDLYESDEAYDAAVAGDDYAPGTLDYALDMERTPYGDLGDVQYLVFEFFDNSGYPGSGDENKLGETVIENNDPAVANSWGQGWQEDGRTSIPEGTRYVAAYIVLEDPVPAAQPQQHSASITIFADESIPDGPKPDAFYRFYAGYVDDITEEVCTDVIAWAPVIDEGLAHLKVTWNLFCTYGGAGAAAEVVVALFCYPALYDEDGAPYPDLDNPIATVGWDAGTDWNATTGYHETWISGTIPAGTRFMYARGIVAPYLPLFSVIENDNYGFEAHYVPILNAHCQIDGSLGPLPDANPAHMIYAAMTNGTFGANEPVANMNDASFQAAAQIYYEEGLGLSVEWNKETRVEDFIQDVIDHTKSVMFPDPEDGKWNLVPLRDNYVVEDIDVHLNPSNCDASNQRRVFWGETANQLTVKYTDPQTEQDASVTVFDSAGIAIHGKPLTDTRNYRMARNADLASKLGERDLREVSYPLYSATLTVDRRRYRIKPGDVILFTWPDDNVADMVMRVMRVKYGSSSDRKIELSVVEDIFGLESAVYSAPQQTIWESDAVVPQPLAYQHVTEAPYPALVLAGLSASEIEEYEGAELVMAMGWGTNPTPIDIQVWAQPDGGASSQVGTVTPSKAGVTTAALVAELRSVLPGALVTSLFQGLPEIGKMILLTDGSNEELVVLEGYNATADTWMALRGIWDTVPRAWAAGTTAFAFSKSGSQGLPNEFAPAEDIDFRLLPKARNARLGYSSAVPVERTVRYRQNAPIRPANTQLEESGFDTLFLPDPGSRPATVTASWVNRNRTTEDAIFHAWDDDTVTPEVDQTVTLRIYDTGGTLQTEITGLTGTSRELTYGELAVTEGYVEFWAVRDGIESFDAARRSFSLTAKGWGYNWGSDWGGIVVGWGKDWGRKWGGSL